MCLRGGQPGQELVYFTDDNGLRGYADRMCSLGYPVHVVTTREARDMSELFDYLHTHFSHALEVGIPPMMQTVACNTAL